MKILLTISDVRQYRQLSKQVNTDSFEGHVRSVQQNQLCELLNPALCYDFFNFLDNGFSSYTGTWSRDSVNQITIVGADVSSWVNYSLKINDNIFVIVSSAIFGGIDTILTVTGYDLPTTITTLSYSTENKYVKLLNGDTYIYDSNIIQYNGLRPFLVWHLLSSYLVDGSLKQADLGNINIMGEHFTGASQGLIREAKSEYLQNSTREQNHISKYLNSNITTYNLWESTSQKNITTFDFMII